jgi:hypothetical protein
MYGLVGGLSLDVEKMRCAAQRAGQEGYPCLNMIDIMKNKVRSRRSPLCLIFIFFKVHFLVGMSI